MQSSLRTGTSSSENTARSRVVGGLKYSSLPAKGLALHRSGLIPGNGYCPQLVVAVLYKAMELTVLIVLATLIVLLVLSLLIGKRGYGKESTPLRRDTPKHCVLCGERLPRKESIRVAQYPADESGERLVEVYGCSRCSSRGRGLRGLSSTPHCPVCRGVLDRGEAVYARMSRPSRRAKIAIVGCSKCYSQAVRLQSRTTTNYQPLTRGIRKDSLG